MQERNVLSGAVAAFLTPFVDGLQSLTVWLIVAVVLVIGDLRFGTEAARKRGEKIRGSRIARRTMNKLVDYICWISIAGALGGSYGKMFGIPLLPALMMMLVYIIELSSIINNYLEIKGIDKKINSVKLIGKILHKDVDDVLEDKE